MPASAKSTPGPWFVGPVNADGWRRVGPTEQPNLTEPAIAFVFGVDSANAHLIAAAPDLLEACRIALRLLEAHGQTHDTATGPEPIMDQYDTGLSAPLSHMLLAAIYKAGGRAARVPRRG